ncbi:MAG: tRNA (guanosine(37)-N1)-methyltransferase TrmD [Lachnospiraceae bacterium]|nr:tRNA (guanosine(37)-N1)-methyltransferase TrmD [Lachnospiraceae bacterium]
MDFHIMTLFPDMVMSALSESIIGRAAEKGLVSVEAVNIRDFAHNKHNKVDDYTYGGGAGMLMQAEPVYLCYEDIIKRIREKKGGSGEDNRVRVVYMTPQGGVFDQKMAEEFSKEEDIVILCGHYEGIDERVLDEIVTDHVSVGDYVLTGGEIPAMIIVDAVSRLLPGVLSNEESGITESFGDGLLEYPQYSRPEEWHCVKVPPVLISGDHEKVAAWRHEQSLLRTMERRFDLFRKYVRSHPDEFAPKKKRRKRK